MASNSSKTPLLAFDGLELRNKIIAKLNQGQVFTDQNYQGSNLSALTDILGMVFGTLQFYNSRSSSENMYSEAQLYENMNRIVSVLQYNPVGRISQNVPFSLTATADLPKSTYIIPRFSYLLVGGTVFSLSTDLSFSKLTNLEEVVDDLDNNHLLHQGAFEEYPTQNAVGIENEVFYLSLNSDVEVDHFNIFVYVKNSSGVWEEWKRVESLSLYTGNDTVFEARFNANKRYELTFGDDINGAKLSTNDQVAIYYLKIDPKAATIGANALNASSFIPFNSIQFNKVLYDTKTLHGTYLNPSYFKFVTPTNAYPSSDYTSEESVDSIRKNAPKVFRSQNRLTSLDDYDFFVKTNFKNLLSDSMVVNNDKFLRGHLRYLYNIGLKDPQKESQVLFNQIKFANSCNFNNLYIYAVPLRNTTYLGSTQKEYIVNNIEKFKSATAHLVPMDPEYMNFDFYVRAPGETPSVDLISQSKLRIFKDTKSKRSSSAIKFDVISLLKESFRKGSAKLGQNINTHQLTTDILSVEGISSIQTYRADLNIWVSEVSFLVWNAKYPKNDVNVYTQTVQLDYFMYPILAAIDNLTERIEIVDYGTAIKVAEF